MKWRVLHAINVVVGRLSPRARTVLESVYFATAIARNPRSFVRYLRLLLIPRTPVEVSLRGSPHPVFLRPATTDAVVAFDTLGGDHHLPSRPLPDDATIIDLGANIGLTAADYAFRYPRATVIAVEMDESNADMCELNTAAYRDRVTILRTAVWWESTQLSYTPQRGEEWGFAVAEQGERQVTAISLAELVAQYGPVDFLNMDIEGAEADVLAHNTSWAPAVKSLQVEVHEPYTVEQCTAVLQELGFVTEHHNTQPAVFGTRPTP